MAYSLASHGDGYEQGYYNAFIKSEFPSYDGFWVKHVVPLTNRPANIHFKTDPQLALAVKTAQDVCIAQLHYSVLRHLARAYEIRHRAQVTVDDLTEGMVRLSGAQDVAFELLERYTNPATYDPWLAQRTGGKDGGKEARQAWQKRDAYPLQNLRGYRNHLVHGRVSPSVMLNGVWYVPQIGKEAAYFDWRAVTQHANPQSLIANDFVMPEDVLDDAWGSTIKYFEAKWQAHLL